MLLEEAPSLLGLFFYSQNQCWIFSDAFLVPSAMTDDQLPRRFFSYLWDVKEIILGSGNSWRLDVSVIDRSTSALYQTLPTSHRSRAALLDFCYWNKYPRRLACKERMFHACVCVFMWRPEVHTGVFSNRYLVFGDRISH